MQYILCDRETNNVVFDTFSTEWEAIASLEKHEKEDKINWNYVENYYEIHRTLWFN